MPRIRRRVSLSWLALAAPGVPVACGSSGSSGTTLDASSDSSMLDAQPEATSMSDAGGDSTTGVQAGGAEGGSESGSATSPEAGPDGARPDASADASADLDGEMRQLLRDTENPYQDPCTDCAFIAMPDTSRVTRGAGFEDPGANLPSWVRYSTQVGTRGDYLGFRCARTP